MSETAGSKALLCPKCNEPMRELKAGSVLVDRCGKCFGIWLDKGERLKVQQDRSLIAGLDIGPKAVGKETDKITKCLCPRCGEPMQHVKDRGQRHVGFEFCRACQGLFLDAGELRDLSELTLTERIKALLGAH
jgi:Zn-finger nucleic acid-binding protein